MKPRLTERDVTQQCLAWLRIKGWRPIRLQSALANDNGRRYRIGEPGIPDWLLVRGGKEYLAECWFLELKALGKKPSPQQLIWHEDARHLGLPVCVADSLESLQEWTTINLS